jgi:hypothetical protein
MGNHPGEQRMSNGMIRKSKSKEQYVKNKTFEFPTNYINSMINSNVEFVAEEQQNPHQFYMTMIKGHNRASSKKKAKRPDCR